MNNKTDTANFPTIGSEFLSGNSLCPTTDKVLGICSYDIIPSSERKAHDTLGPQHGYDPTACLYVLYRASNRKGLQASPVDTFMATRYATHDDMVEAYAA